VMLQIVSDQTSSSMLWLGMNHNKWELVGTGAGTGKRMTVDTQVMFKDCLTKCVGYLVLAAFW
jgi:hypothetical protein